MRFSYGQYSRCVPIAIMLTTTGFSDLVGRKIY